jgi:hypothetical protein
MVVPWVTAVMILVALWPTLCMSGGRRADHLPERGFLPLPWGESADTRGWLVAIVAAMITFIVLRIALRRRERDVRN